MNSMGLGVLIGLAVVAFLVGDIFALSYVWIRRRLGEIEPELIPAARTSRSPKHGGFRREPTWLRPLQATLIAMGLTVWISCALAFLMIGAASLVL
jgi:hypothetical protein